MDNPETYILKQNRSNRHLLDIFLDGGKAGIYKAPNRATDFDEIKKLLSLSF